MSIVTELPGSRVSVLELPRRKFSVAEYHDFIERGVFKPEERIELWEGEFIEMSPIGMRHASCVMFLIEVFRDLLGKSVVISPQNPIVLDDLSEPQPDVCLLARREDFYRNSNADAKDVLLVMEVADTTVKFDRDVKFPKYSSNGIEEAWLIDLESNRVEIHSVPTNEGYSLVRIFHFGETAQSTVLTDLKISVDSIIG